MSQQREITIKHVKIQAWMNFAVNDAVFHLLFMLFSSAINISNHSIIWYSIIWYNIIWYNIIWYCNMLWGVSIHCWQLLVSAFPISSYVRIHRLQWVCRCFTLECSHQNIIYEFNSRRLYFLAYKLYSYMHEGNTLLLSVQEILYNDGH